MRKSYFLLFYISFCSQFVLGQEITQFEVFAGRYDYLAIGNTLNTQENGNNNPCELLDESSATLSLEADQSIIAAYLYWAGSGTGDFEVLLNDIPITAERTFADEIDDARPFFAAFTDITSLIGTNGLGEYTFSGLDLSEVLPTYCPSGTNFAGWSIIVVYEDLDLPLNQVNIFDGLESVSQFNSELTIQLNNLNVLDNDNAKIGFLAWEGDANLAVEETLSINGNLLSNPPLNPTNNQFNGTNTFTNASNLYNMDIDVYNIENNIAIGDTQATIQLTSGQDFVMINTIITVLNSQLPDAIIAVDDVISICNNRTLEITYTVTNQGTEVLPANTEIGFYGNTIYTGSAFTMDPIEIGESQTYTTTLTIIEAIPTTFDLVAIVDDPNAVIENNEGNNESLLIPVELIVEDITIIMSSLIACNEGFETGVFDLFEVEDNLALASDQFITGFYTSLDDALLESNAIIDPAAYENILNPQTIYLRIEGDDVNVCFEIAQINLSLENCPPFVPEGFSPNADGLNDAFRISGLKDVFENYELLIYSRLGNLVYQGDNDVAFWNGVPNRGIGGTEVPTGVYYWVLFLNDSQNEDMTGWVYLNR